MKIINNQLNLILPNLVMNLHETTLFFGNQNPSII